MKPYSYLMTALFLAAVPANAQVTVVVPPVTVPAPLPGGVAIVETPAPGVTVRTVRTVDDARRQLMMAPRAVVVEPTLTPPAPAPNTSSTTVKTTTVVDTPGRPLRVYNQERQVVVVQEQEQTRELPYVTVPVLFVKATADLLDAASADAIQQMAGVVMEVSRTEPNAVFDIEGHTSTDGTDETNMALAASRAQRVYDELTQRFGVPARLLSAHGYGEMFPAYPNGSEDQMQLDRRVLIVRTR